MVCATDIIIHKNSCRCWFGVKSMFTEKTFGYNVRNDVQIFNQWRSWRNLNILLLLPLLLQIFSQLWIAPGAEVSGLNQRSTAKGSVGEVCMMVSSEPEALDPRWRTAHRLPVGGVKTNFEFHFLLLFFPTPLAHLCCGPPEKTLEHHYYQHFIALGQLIRSSGCYSNSARGPSPAVEPGSWSESHWLFTVLSASLDLKCL